LSRIQRLHLLAAALTIVGVAGLVYALAGLLAEPELGTASDDPVIFSIGDVPEPIGVVPEATPDPNATVPALPERSDTTASDAADDSTVNAPPKTPARQDPDSGPISFGDSANGLRSRTSFAMEPTDIHIPKIDVRASIVQVGTTEDGAMESPLLYSDVGWWSLGVQPGEAGRAVLAGHVDSPWGPAVFVRLDELAPGDEILIGNGLAELRYIVRGAAVYRADAAPVESIFGPSTERELVLITCGGRFDRSTASYLHRRVVFAVLADDSSPNASE
jgi:LPXTG-site transpeptidase (sortase) family protein